MKVGDTDLSGHSRPYFIAEAGVNHNGDLQMAEQLIDEAVAAGADAVKFQTFNADRLVVESASRAEYQKNDTEEESQYEMLKEYELGKAEHKRLKSYCDERGITFLSTPFDHESADFLADLGVPAIKVGSGELDNHPFLSHIASLGVPMIVSTGMGTMKDVREADEVINSVQSPPEVAFLHCTSAYPAPIEEVNLRAMQTMDAELSAPVGYSDHTALPETPALAVTAGATVIEKHFTIDSTLPGPDHEASLEPNELSRAITLAETAWKARGTAEKKPTPSEEKNITTSRKSLHASETLPSGATIDVAHIDVLRPATGLSPKLFDEIVGKETKNEVKEGEPIRQDDLHWGETN